MLEASVLAILGARLSRPRLLPTPANTGQTSAALSERNASYQHPGFRFAHRFAPPWAKVSHAFGVFPDASPDNNSTSEPFVTLNTCGSGESSCSLREEFKNSSDSCIKN